jgi:hypothetical protein
MRRRRSTPTRASCPARPWRTAIAGRAAGGGLPHQKGGDHALHRRHPQSDRGRDGDQGQHRHGRGLLRCPRSRAREHPDRHRQELSHRIRHPRQERAHRRRRQDPALPARPQGCGRQAVLRPRWDRGDRQGYRDPGRDEDRASLLISYPCQASLGLWLA